MKVIPIISTHEAAAASCGDDSGEVPQQNLPHTRRSLLRGSGLLRGTLAAGSTLALLAPSRSWAAKLKTRSSAEGATLMSMGRVLYPHAKLPDAVYALLAKDLDAGATSDGKNHPAAARRHHRPGQGAGRSFSKATPAKKLAVVKAMEGTPFFAAVRGKCVTSLYDNDMAFAAWGYPGSSREKGGYITRGFQDLKRLPAPSAAASPVPWMG